MTSEVATREPITIGAVIHAEPASRTAAAMQAARTSTPAQPPVFTRADDQQIERRAVQRQLLGWAAVRGVRLDVFEGRDAPARVVDHLLDCLLDRLPSPTLFLPSRSTRATGRSTLSTARS